MWILPLVGYLGVILGFSFLTLAIASGLYYLSEIVEEHTVIARRLLYRLIYAVIGAQILLFVVDRLPFTLSVFNIVSHVIYSSNLRRFPFVQLSDPLFIISCLLVGLNHYLWFQHFSDPMAMATRKSYSSRSYSGQNSHFYHDSSSQLEVPTFTQIASFFALCVWLVPFALFVSLSASENVLPSMVSEAPAHMDNTHGMSPDGLGGVGGTRHKSKGMLKALVDGIGGWVSETSQIAGFRRTNKEKY